MNYRSFGNTTLRVSEIGFGAWAIGGNAVVGGTPIGWGPADDATSKAAIHAALDAGINFFDTADFYGLGHSESLLGSVLKGQPEAIIATKVGHRAIEERIQLDYSREWIFEACAASLRRLQRESIDYYQLHSARMSHLQAGECIDAMERLQEQGKIRHWGLSLNTFHPEAEAHYLMAEGKAEGFQLVFNLINQRALQLMAKAGAQGYGLIARMPLQFGLLTGKFTRQTQFSADDHRSFRLTGDVLDEALGILEAEVWPLARELQLSPTEMALSFILSFPEISTIIPGIRTPKHVEQNTSNLRILPDAVKQQLTELGETKWKAVVETMERLG